MGEGFKTSRTYKVTTNQEGNGNHCPHEHGFQEGLEKLPPNTDCVGGWETDTIPLPGWKESRTYKITIPQEGNGKHCPFVHGYREGVTELPPPKPVDDKPTYALKFGRKVGDKTSNGGILLNDCGIVTLVDTEGNE